MRKVILTESQAKLLLEEIDKNDSIQKLIFCNPSDIQFEVSNEIPAGVSVSRNLFHLTPVIDGKEIDGKFLNFLAEEVKINGEQYYQLHINVNKEIRRLGIAYKLYLAFLLQDYPVCSLFKNRVSSFYDENWSENQSDSAISGLWAKIANEPGIVVDDLIDKNGNKVGIKAYHE
jgi:hypothetical protein